MTDLLEKHIRMNQEILNLPRNEFTSVALIEENQALLLELRMWRENVRHPKHMKERLQHVYKMSERVINKPAIKEYMREAFLLEWVLTPEKEDKQ